MAVTAESSTKMIMMMMTTTTTMTSTTMTMMMMSEEEAMINDSIYMNPRRNKMRKKIKSVYDIVLSVNLKKNEVTPEKVTFYHVLPRSRNTKLKHRSFNVKNMKVSLAIHKENKQIWRWEGR